MTIDRRCTSHQRRARLSELAKARRERESSQPDPRTPRRPQDEEHATGKPDKARAEAEELAK